MRVRGARSQHAVDILVELARTGVRTADRHPRSVRRGHGRTPRAAQPWIGEAGQPASPNWVVRAARRLHRASGAFAIDETSVPCKGLDSVAPRRRAAEVCVSKHPAEGWDGNGARCSPVTRSPARAAPHETAQRRVAPRCGTLVPPHAPRLSQMRNRGVFFVVGVLCAKRAGN